MGRRTRWLIAVVALIALAGMAVFMFRARVGEAIFARGVDTRAGRDIVKGLPDGLHVALCGTGSPLPSAARSGPCNVVIAGRHIFVIDTGEGAARNIALMGIPLGRVEGVLLTHFHSDHIDGIGPVMLQRWTGASARSPLPVYGPLGVERIVGGFNEAYATDNGYRVAHHGPDIVPPSGAGAVAIPFALAALKPGGLTTVLEQDGLKVTAFPVDHGPVSPAVGYRFDYKGRSVVLSGDTSRSASLIAAAHGADMLVHEALQPRMVLEMAEALDSRGMPNTAQILRDIPNYHTSPEQAAEVARAAGVRQLVLSHIVPPIPSGFLSAAFLGDAAKRYSGPIIMGEDGMLFSLPAGKTAIDSKSLF